jgi:hypothetical protein
MDSDIAAHMNMEKWVLECSLYVMYVCMYLFIYLFIYVCAPC